MLLDNTNTNLPEASVGQVIDTLTTLYTNAINTGLPLRSIPAPFLWGPCGVGKSEGVRQLAAALERNTGRRISVTDVRLLLFSPVDLRGVPVASADGFSDWLKPRVFDMDASDDCVNILFLDELSAAPQSVQTAAYQITLDRVIGEHRLPENCIVIAAGNRTTDRSVSFRMPHALANRLLHFNVRSDVFSWLEWSIHQGIDRRVIGYVSFDNSRLNMTPETSDMAFPTPRSWTFVSNLLKAMQPEKVSDIHMLIASAVGVDTAVAFEAFCEVYASLPDIRQIFKGVCTIYPQSPQVLYALISSLVAAVGDMEDVSATELENVCAYAVRFPADFAMTFFSDLSRIDGVKEKLTRISVLQQWLSKKHRRLA